MRYGAKINKKRVTDVFVIADGEEGDATISELKLVEKPGIRPGVGWSWDGSDFAPPPPPAPTWEDVRLRRNSLLAQSDWTQIADAPVDASAWASYRQQLRDIPQSNDDPENVSWPTPPWGVA